MTRPEISSETDTETFFRPNISDTKIFFGTKFLETDSDILKKNSKISIHRAWKGAYTDHPNKRTFIDSKAYCFTGQKLCLKISNMEGFLNRVISTKQPSPSWSFVESWLVFFYNFHSKAGFDEFHIPDTVSKFDII